MILLCLGVFLVTWTQIVTADPIVLSNSYTVNASVPGPPPTIAATIDTPADGAVFTEQPIDVGGTCPLNTYVTLYRNGSFSGVAICEANGTWGLQTGLFPGVNQLQARVFSQTDVPGPMSTTVTVTYKLPTPPVAPGGTPSPTGGGASTPSGTRGSAGTLQEPLIFKTTYNYQGHYTGQPSTWQLVLEGGVAPYAISVDWGDGERDLISQSKPGVFSAEHIYKKPGAYKGHYVIKFSASDAQGEKAFLQLLTIVNDRPATGAGTKPNLPPSFGPTPGYFSGVMKYIWPGYIIILLMLTSFWLGERREYNILKPRLKRRRHA